MSRLRLLLLLAAITLLGTGMPVRGAGGDPYLDEQWQERASGIAALRAAGGDGAGVVVGIVDGGFDLDHPDLDGIDLRYLPPADGDPFADAHGTGILGVLAAETGNGRGIAGIVPRARVIAQATGPEDDDRLLGYLERLADDGARVINVSLGYEAAISGSSLARAYESLRDRGVLVVAAAGNYGEADIRIYPSRLDAVISVGAHDRAGGWAAFSNQGAVTISAPGVEIPATRKGGGYALRSGTSLATPIVSGVIAALMSLDATLSSEGVVALLLETAGAADGGPSRLDARAALERLRTGEPLVRFTELPKLPRTSLSQPVTIRTGSVGPVGGCIVSLSLDGRSIEWPCDERRSTTLGTLLDQLGWDRKRSGMIEARLDSDRGGGDAGTIEFDLDAPAWEPEPDDLVPPALVPVAGTAPFAEPGRPATTEVRLVDARGLRARNAFCDEISSRRRSAAGVPGPWSRQVDETFHFPYRLEGESIVLSLDATGGGDPGRIEWRIVCADGSGNFAPPTIVSVAIPFEGASLSWSAGNYLLPSPGARSGDLSVTRVAGATIERTGFGRTVALVGPTGPGLGRIEVTIDGRSSCVVDLARHGDGTARQARMRTLLLGPGSRCGSVALSALGDAPALHRVTLRALPGAEGTVVPIDAIAFW